MWWIFNWIKKRICIWATSLEKWKIPFSYCFIGVHFCLVVIGYLIVDEASLSEKVLLTSPLPHAICHTLERVQSAQHCVCSYKLHVEHWQCGFFFWLWLLELVLTGGKEDILVIILGSPLVLTEEACKAFARFTVHVHACFYIIQNCMCIHFLQNLDWPFLLKWLHSQMNRRDVS